MTTWTRIALPFAALLLGACSTPPTQVTSASGPGSGSGESSSTSGSPTTTMPATTTSGEDTVVATEGGSGMDTTMGVDPTTSDGTTMGVDPTTSDGTTMGVDPTTSGSSSGGPPPECMVPSDCPNNETCDGMGQCVPACNPWGDGHYGYCLTPLGKFDSTVLCGEALSCINSGNPIEVVVCGRSCATQCDCAEPPPTGNATVTCGNITGGGNRCYLSCANGETCPDDMVCREGTYCAHPVQPLEMYGDCGGVAAPCANGGVCATGVAGGDSWAVCTSSCGNVGECDMAPPGASGGAGCGQVYPASAGDECHLDCSSSTDCLPGMTCVDFGGGYGNWCMWLQ